MIGRTGLTTRAGGPTARLTSHIGIGLTPEMVGLRPVLTTHVRGHVLQTHLPAAVVVILEHCSVFFSAFCGQISPSSFSVVSHSYESQNRR